MNHYCVLSGIDVVQLPRIFGGAGSFFAISGFLMFPSYEKRPDVKRYLKRRAQRITPPYFLIVILAAIALVFVSDLSPVVYFTSGGFWKYLAANLSFMNFLAPSLPGVFTEATNNVSAVNGSLWTMKGEVACYFTVPLIFYIVKRYRFGMIRILQFLMLIFAIGYITFEYIEYAGHPSADIAARQCMVMFLFYMGGYLNARISDIRKHWKSIIAICGIILIFNYLNRYWINVTIPCPLDSIFYWIIIPLCNGLMVIACSIIGKWGKPLANHDAITYEIYLFHFPVIQLFVYSGLIQAIGFYSALAIAFVLVAIMGWASHKYIDNGLIKHIWR